MYQITPDGLAAEATYRRERLAADYRRGAGPQGRRWHRTRRADRTRIS